MTFKHGFTKLLLGILSVRVQLTNWFQLLPESDHDNHFIECYRRWNR